jgi:hypothetical protein
MVSCPDCSISFLLPVSVSTTAFSEQKLVSPPLLEITSQNVPISSPEKETWEFLDQEEAYPFLSAFRRGTEEPDAPALADLHCNPLPTPLPRKATVLGAPMASLNFGHSRYLGRWLIGSGCTVVGLILLLIFVNKIVEARPQGLTIDVLTPLFGSLTFLAFGFISIVSALLAVRRSPAGTLWICHEGLIWQRRGLVGSCAWHEVLDFYASKTRTQVKKPAFWESDQIEPRVLVGMKQLTPRYSGQAHWTYHYVLVCPETKPFIFSSESAPDEVKAFGDRIQFETTRALLPVYRQRLQRGETLVFLPFHLNPQGLYLGKENIPWSELMAITTGNNLVTIYQKGGQAWRKIPFGEISHACAFIVLVDEMLQSRGGPDQQRAENSFSF